MKRDGQIEELLADYENMVNTIKSKE